ncbi:MAG: hypothetical protein QME49_04890 [bacterium]|nr:hypothetical protein [bacterium]
MIVVYNGSVDSIKNRYGIFQKGIPVEISTEVGLGLTTYPYFCEDIPQEKEEKAKKNGKKDGEK